MNEQFSTPRTNVIESDAGFSVQVLGRTGIRYSEDGRTAFVDSEALATPGAMVVYQNSITKWDQPHESKPLDDDDRQRIIGNIRRAFEFRGHTLQVI